MFEKVNPGHPDKFSDTISGALVDEAYRLNPDCKIAVEILLGHGVCHIISETSEKIDKNFVYNTVHRICQNDNIYVLYDEYLQDPILASNQKGKIRCGDNGIFKGVPVTSEEQALTNIAKQIYDIYPYDGKYVLDGDKLIVCQSHCNSKELLKSLQDKYPEYNIIVNPLGDWTGGPSVDTGACLNEDSSIYTKKGIIPIKNLQVGDVVYTENSIANVVGVFDKGIKNTIILQDEYGGEIEATPDHKFRVFDGQNLVWKDCEDLEIGDILVRRSIDHLCTAPKKISSFKFPIYDSSGTHQKLSTRTIKMDSDFYYLMGYLVGDGNYTANDRISFYYGSDSTKNHLFELLKRVFGQDLIKQYEYQDDRFLILSSGLVDELEKLGLKKTVAHDKEIPSFVFKANDYLKGSFISGLFDADGTTRTYTSEGRTAEVLHVSLATSSSKLAQQTKILLHSLGIDSTIAPVKKPTHPIYICGKLVKTTHDSFTVSIRGRNSLKNFVQKCNFRLQNKSTITMNHRFERYLYDNDSFYLIETVTKLLDMDKSKKSKYFSKHCSTTTRQGYKKQTIDYILDMYKEFENTKEYKTIKYIYDTLKMVKISNIKYGVSRVFDISIDDDSHSFVANGFVTHNCNRKLGSDMAQSVSGGGINGKDISKADVSVNVYCFLEAQKRNEVVTASCAIGDEKVTFASSSGDTWTLDYQKIVKIAKDYIDSLGGFEKFAEWGLVRPK